MFQNQVQRAINAILHLTFELQFRLACCTPLQGRLAKLSRHESPLDLNVPAPPAVLTIRRDFASGQQVYMLQRFNSSKAYDIYEYIWSVGRWLF